MGKIICRNDSLIRVLPSIHATCKIMASAGTIQRTTAAVSLKAFPGSIAPHHHIPASQEEASLATHPRNKLSLQIQQSRQAPVNF